ncbi:MAG: hypothetical protein WC787_00230 [Patescibacteria group bacterium]|jgi:hypothetical protein
MEPKQKDYHEDEALMKHWRSWGSWYSWGSATGLGLFLISVGILLVLLHVAELI